MQNDDYYELYMQEWEKMLGHTEQIVTDAEREELHELVTGQKDNRHD